MAVRDRGRRLSKSSQSKISLTVYLVDQRGRGRSGRAVSERGRIRRRPSGGGTLRRKSPQHGQRPSLATGPVTSARSQWPRSSHVGLMHCTVRPGKYCIVSPQWPHGPDSSAADTLEQERAAKPLESPGGPAAPPRSPEGERMARGSAAQATNREPRGNSELDGAHSALSTLWCQEENTTRYCGKVAAVKNLVLGPQSSRRRKRVASQRECGDGPRTTVEIERRISAY